jgi:two-component system, NtrC family, response regulator AlgB
VMLWPSATIEPHAFPDRIASRAAAAAPPAVGGELTLEDLEREHILRVLARRDTLEEAAASLGIDVSTLWRKRRKYGV